MDSDSAAVGRAGALENIRAHVVAVEWSTGQSLAEAKDEDACGLVWSTGHAEGWEDAEPWSTGHCEEEDILVREQLM